MKELKLTNKQIEDIYFGESERFIVVEEGSWESYGKGETMSFIFKDSETDVHYSATIGRSGSHWTDYTYDSEMFSETFELVPCEQKEVVVLKWFNIKGDFETEDLTGKEDL